MRVYRLDALHDLKTSPEYFEAVWRGEKRFEIRKDDRNFQVGDTLYLREYDPWAEQYTGRTRRMRVTYLYRGEWVAPGYCVMSIKKLPDIGDHL